MTLITAISFMKRPLKKPPKSEEYLYFVHIIPERPFPCETTGATKLLNSLPQPTWVSGEGDLSRATGTRRLSTAS